MKKIGIVTNYANINYGSALQSYALQTTLRALGFDCENIRYAYGRSVTVASSLRGLLGHAKRRLLPHDPRTEKFRSFRRTFIKESARTYGTPDDLRDANSVYDAFICGSDQIWAPNQFNEWYYLSFVDRDKLKIAYAPSIGLPALPPDLEDPIRNLVVRLDHVSIREDAGAKLLRNLAGLEAPVVLDPTLLLEPEAWRQLASGPVVKGSYALCYLLGDRPEHRKMARTYCDSHGLRLVAPYAKGDMSMFDEVLTGIGPREFLSLLLHARTVLTDSFHGAAFSINLEKDFHAFLRFSPDDALCQNSRMYNLLRMFDLSDRLIERDSGTLPACRPVHAATVRHLLEEQRSTSTQFLVNALSGLGNEP